MFDFIAQLLYPKKCVKCGTPGDYVCDKCMASIHFLDHQLCGVCQRGTINGMTHPGCKTPYGIDGIISAISYKGIVKKLLYQFKYKPYLSDLKGILGRIFYEGLIQEEAFIKFINQKNVIVTAVPLHLHRYRTRGYNQSELLAKEISRRLGLEFSSNVLTRVKKTKPQFELSKEERKKNLRGAFDISKEFKGNIKGGAVILVDDITTTGATLRECAKILKIHGVKKVLGVTLAHEEQ